MDPKQEAKLEEVKKLLRAVLMSQKAVDEDFILKDYKSITGQLIPFKEFNCRNFQEFAKHLPDVVQPVRGPSGGIMYKAVATAETAHIQRMVAAQRSSKKKGKKGFRSRRPPTHSAFQFRARQTPRSTFYSSRSSSGGFAKPTHFGAAPNRSTFGTGRNNSADQNRSGSPSNLAKPRPVNTNWKSAKTETPPLGIPTLQSVVTSKPSSQVKMTPLTRHVSESTPGFLEITVSKSKQKCAFAHPQKKREVYQLPSGTFSVTVQRSPDFKPKPSSAAAKLDGTKFGSSYSVPPRFQKRMQAQKTSPTTSPTKAVSEYDAMFDKVEAYTTRRGLDPVQYETVHVKDGYASSFSLENKIYGSLGVFSSKERAEYFAAKTAVVELGLDKEEQSQSVRKSMQGLELNQEIYKQQVKRLLENHPRGLWMQRLHIVYKDNFKKDIPAGLTDILELWTDVVTIEEHSGHKIIYKLQDKAPEIKIPAATLPAEGTSVIVLLVMVLDCDMFYVHVQNLNKVQTIQDLLNDIYVSKTRGRVEALDEVKEGVYCVALYDDIYYRAQVLSIIKSNKQTQLIVYYVDFGNTDTVTLDMVYKLDPSVAKFPVQAIKCKLHNVYKKEESSWRQAVGQLEELDMTKPYKVDITSHENGDCSVVLYTTKDGPSFNQTLVRQGLVWGQLFNRAKDPGPLLLPPEDDWDVIVNFLEGGNRIAISILGENYSDSLVQLEEAISEKYVSCSQDVMPQVGDICAARDTAAEEGENSWFRVKVLSITENKAQCQYLDYGDTQDVKLEDLRVLEEGDNPLPYQIISVQLTGLENIEQAESNDKILIDLILGKTYVANVNSREGTSISVTLFDTVGDEDVNMNEEITERLDIEQLSPMVPADLDTGKCYVTHIRQNDGGIFIQIPGPGLQMMEHLTELVTQEIQTAGASLFVKNPEVEKLVMARYLNDCWYRAAIMEVLPSRKVVVFFVDYGNVEVVPFNSLRELEPANKKFYKMPHQVIECRLDGVPPRDSSWTKAALRRLEELAPDIEMLTVEVIKNPEDCEDPVIIELHRSMDDELMAISNLLLADEDIWKEDSEDTEDSSSSISDLPTSDLLPRTEGSISSSDSQHGDLNTDSNTQSPVVMTTQNGDLSPSASQSVVCEKALTNNNYKDYSVNESEESTVDSFSMENGISDAELSAAIQELNVKAAQRQSSQPRSDTSETQQVAAPASGGEPSQHVELPASEGTRLDRFGLPYPPSVSWPKSGEEVHVTWVSHPHEFMCVPRASMKALVDLMHDMTALYDQQKDLKAPERVELGALYVGQHADGSWYRIQVKSIFDQTKVCAYFLDYGDFNMVDVDNLRPLLVEFRSLPFQAIKSMLSGVIGTEPGGQWSSDANSRFEDIVLEKNLTVRTQGITENACVMPMALILQGSDLSVHDILIHEGLAVPSTTSSS